MLHVLLNRSPVTLTRIPAAPIGSCQVADAIAHQKVPGAIERGKSYCIRTGKAKKSHFFSLLFYPFTSVLTPDFIRFLNPVGETDVATRPVASRSPSTNVSVPKWGLCACWEIDRMLTHVSENLSTYLVHSIQWVTSKTTRRAAEQSNRTRTQRLQALWSAVSCFKPQRISTVATP